LKAFRSARVAERLGPRNDACPIASGELLAPAKALGLVVPVVRSPIAAVARAALVAARTLDSAIGLALPAGVPVGPWFEAVARAADEWAGGLPVVLAGEIVLAPDGAVAHAVDAAWRLVDAGMTHVSLDATALEPDERAAALTALAAPAAERGVGIDVVVPLADAARGGGRAASLLEALAERGVRPELTTVRCPAAATPGEARAQAAALSALSSVLGDLPLARRGPISPALLAALARGPVRLCDDGGAAAARALEVLPWEAIPPAEAGPGTRVSALERASRELPSEAADRLEARAYVEASDLVERLGACGSARALAAAIAAGREGGDR
jgi:hypothetical protein